MDIIRRCAPKISVDITPGLCLSYGCIVGHSGNEPRTALSSGVLPHGQWLTPLLTKSHQGEPHMARFKITIKVFTTNPPHEALSSSHTIQAGTMADAYLKLAATVRTMAPVAENPDAKS